MASKTEKKSRIEYQSDIITREITYENPIDESKIPVFKLENCEILNSSLGNASPKFGHNVQVLLPVGTDFNQKDRIIRNGYLATVREENANLEYVKGSVVAYTNKDVLEGVITEEKVGRFHMNFTISNSYLFERSIDAEGKESDKKISKEADADPSNRVIQKYFRALDGFTGKGIDPQVFKYENGEKVYTFVNPKTKEEKPLYLGRGDIVNITIRPFGVKNQKTGEFTLRYNLLSVEIVQTAWDRGIGRKGGASSQTKETPDSIGAGSLSSIFAGLSGMVTTTTTAQSQPVVTPTPVAVQPTVTPVASTVQTAPTVNEVQAQTVVTQPVVQEATPVVATQPTPTVSTAPTPTTEPVQETVVPVLDFSALANIAVGNLNLGE